MHDIQATDVLNASYDLLEESACLLLFDPLHLYYVVEKLAALSIFHNQVQLFLGLDDLVELDDLGVSDYLQNMDLSGHALHIGDITDLGLLEDLDGNFLSGGEVSPQFHLAEGALSYRFPEKILPDGLVWPFLGVRRLLRHFLIY